MSSEHKMKHHTYELRIQWTGNLGDGTRSYRGYKRDNLIAAAGKPDILGSSDPAFRGDPSRYSPEELLVAALAQCHMLAYLHLCATNGVVVEAYEDRASGTMRENPDGSGEFTNVTLRPLVTISGGDPGRAHALHEDAHHLCFIARSVNFEVNCSAEILSSTGQTQQQSQAV